MQVQLPFIPLRFAPPWRMPHHALRRRTPVLCSSASAFTTCRIQQLSTTTTTIESSTSSQVMPAFRLTSSSSCCVSSALHGSRPSTLISVLREPRREKSYHFFMNLDDPEATRLRVEEDLERLADDQRKDTTAYQHSLLNLTLSHFQRGDYISARDLAEYTHQKAFSRNSKSSMLYFTATTCARCADALATDYETHLARMEEQGMVSQALTPRASVVFGAKRAIRKLRADAERYRGIASRVYHRPDMAFMRGDGGQRGWNASRATPGQDRRHAWQDESSNSGVDEEAWSHAYGPAWQSRRTRPEHVELKNYQKRQCAPEANPRSDKRWTVPK